METYDKYVKMRKEIADKTNRGPLLFPRERFTEKIERSFPEKTKYHSYDFMKDRFLGAVKAFKGNLFGWNIRFINFQHSQDRMAAYGFFNDMRHYISPVRMSTTLQVKDLLPEETAEEILKNYLCFEIRGNLTPDPTNVGYRVLAHLVIDLRPTKEQELFFEAKAIVNLDGSGNALTNKEYNSSEVFKEIIREILNLLRLSTFVEIQQGSRGYSFLGKTKIE